MEGRRRKAKPLKRETEKRPELRTIIAFTEGKNSEPDYINGLKKLPHIAENVSLSLEVHPEHGVPLTLVQLAAERKEDQEVDECWCIFDVEWPKNHPNLKSAILLARKKQVELAISNPCFEIWLILHHKDSSSFCTTAIAESASRALDGRPGKSIDASLYMPLRKRASKRAQLLDERHTNNGTQFPHNNPSSGMYRFLAAVEKAPPPQ